MKNPIFTGAAVAIITPMMNLQSLLTFKLKTAPTLL